MLRFSNREKHNMVFNCTDCSLGRSTRANDVPVACDGCPGTQRTERRPALLLGQGPTALLLYLLLFATTTKEAIKN